jgi:hypothetical protein
LGKGTADAPVVDVTAQLRRQRDQLDRAIQELGELPEATVLRGRRDRIDRAIQVLEELSAENALGVHEGRRVAAATPESRRTVEDVSRDLRAPTDRPAPDVFAAPPRSGTSDVPHPQTREGFWFSGGLGWGSAGCEGCLDREGGFSGGLSAGGVVSPRLLVGAGTSGWYKSVDGVTVSGGTFDARLRFYPSLKSGFFLTGGLGLGHVSLGLAGLGSETEYGVGALFGLGWDIRVGRNVSLTPFYNGFAVRTDFLNGNVAQIGLGVTIH